MLRQLSRKTNTSLVAIPFFKLRTNVLVGLGVFYFGKVRFKSVFVLVKNRTKFDRVHMVLNLLAQLSNLAVIYSLNRLITHVVLQSPNKIKCELNNLMRELRAPIKCKS